MKPRKLKPVGLFQGSFIIPYLKYLFADPMVKYYSKKNVLYFCGFTPLGLDRIMTDSLNFLYPAALE